MPLKTPPSPHRLHDLQDILDKLIHFLPQLSDYVPLEHSALSSLVVRLLQDIHDKLVHSFKNRQIYPLKGFIVSTHRLSCPARPVPRPPLDQTQAPKSLKPPPSPHRLFDLQDSLDQLIHFLPQLSDFVPLRNGFYSFRAQTA